MLKGYLPAPVFKSFSELPTHAVQSPACGAPIPWTGLLPTACRVTKQSCIASTAGPPTPWRTRSPSGRPIEVSTLAVPLSKCLMSQHIPCTQSHHQRSGRSLTRVIANSRYLLLAVLHCIGHTVMCMCRCVVQAAGVCRSGSASRAVSVRAPLGRCIGCQPRWRSIASPPAWASACTAESAQPASSCAPSRAAASLPVHAALFTTASNDDDAAPPLRIGLHAIHHGDLKQFCA